MSAVLEPAREISLRTSVDDLFRKALLLAAASWFEHAVTETIVQVAQELSNQSTILVSFLRNKAISRQFHTYFNWESANATQFFGLFGEEFKDHMRGEIAGNPSLEEAIKAFVEIGGERNRMVHEDYGAYSLEKTSEEIYSLYQRALPFVEGLGGHLRSYRQAERPSESVSHPQSCETAP